jgi:hypothetical protein
MPAPSPRTNPFADASNAAHRPSGESIAAEVERFLREASEGGGPSPLPGS